MKQKFVTFVKENKLKTVFVLLLVVVCVIMMSTSPSKAQYEKQVPKEFKELKARIVKKPVYLDYGIVSGYYQSKKINSIKAQNIEYIGVFGKIIEVKEGTKDITIEVAQGEKCERCLTV